MKILNKNGVAGLKVLIAAVLIVAVAGGGWFAWSKYQNNDQQDQQNQEVEVIEGGSEEAAENTSKVVYQATFQGVGQKSGSGSVLLTKDKNNKHQVILQEDFKVQEGPDLYLAFANEGQVDENTLFAPLREFSGLQQYDLPDNLNPEEYTELMIWCKEFSVAFSTAELTEVVPEEPEQEQEQE